MLIFFPGIDEVRFGAKIKDAMLIGFPYIVVGGVPVFLFSIFYGDCQRFSEILKTKIFYPKSEIVFRFLCQLQFQRLYYIFYWIYISFYLSIWFYFTRKNMSLEVISFYVRLFYFSGKSLEGTEARFEVLNRKCGSKQLLTLPEVVNLFETLKLSSL